MTFTGIFLPASIRGPISPIPHCRVETFFLTAELKAAGEATTFLPLNYSANSLDRARTIPIDAALFMATRPNGEGICSFGPVADFLAEVWPRIPSASRISTRGCPAFKGRAPFLSTG